VAVDLHPSRFAGLENRTVIGRCVPVAAGFRSRLLGLSLLSRERAGPGLLIPRCSSVHTFGMRFELDVLFLDDGGRVIELRRSVPPARVVRCAAASAVLELPAP
jgi:uncharacterized protein